MNAPSDEKARRLAQALRANLRRRKAPPPPQPQADPDPPAPET